MKRQEPRSEFRTLTRTESATGARRGCGKTGYPSKKVAEGRARALGKRAYRCPLCKRWHIGGREE